MRIRVLGCDGGIGRGLRTTSFLVDDDLLIDAGTGLGDLSAAALRRIDHVFLTHAHVDHTGTLPLLIDAVWHVRRKPVTVHASAETLDALKTHIFNWRIWPDFTKIPSSERPSMAYASIELGKTVDLAGRRITPIPVKHIIPAVGFRLDSGRASLVFSGDTTCCDDFWGAVNEIANLKYLIIETALPDDKRDIAELSGHLSPAMLATELKKLGRRVEIFITHMKPGAHKIITDEIAALAGAHRPVPLKRGQVLEI